MLAVPKDALSHWHQPLIGLEASPQEFYAAIQERIATQRFPETRVRRVERMEAGIFSAKREYLRVERDHQIFDICGAPFGKGFFVSWWLIAPPPLFIIRLLLLAAPVICWLTVVGTTVAMAAQLVPPMVKLQLSAPEPIGWSAILLIGIGVPVLAIITATIGVFGGLHLLVVFSLIRQETAEATPILGWFYRKMVTPVTYYRIDAALMFSHALHAVVLEAIEVISANKGIRALTEEERKPTMRALLAR